MSANNLLCFRHNLLESIQKVIMAIDERIRDEKMQCNINREAPKISGLALDKIDQFAMPYR